MAEQQSKTLTLNVVGKKCPICGQMHYGAKGCPKQESKQEKQQ